MKTLNVAPGLLLVMLLLVFSASVLNAQGPGPATAPQTVLGTTFTYQGELRHDGVPVSATCQVAFRLYDDVLAGSQVGTAVTLATAVTSGRFTAALDFGAGAFSGQARWLGIRVQCPSDGGFADLGRQALTASPYALYSLSGSASALQGRAVSVATPAAGQALKWDGAAWVPGTDNVGGVGTSWGLTGDVGTNPAVNFLGTTDDRALELRVNGARTLRLEPNATSPNLIGGHSANSVTVGAYGATIGGGGSGANPNRITSLFGVVGGGSGNNVTGFAATVGGGYGNVASGQGASVGGGGYDGFTFSGNAASGGAATIAGGAGNGASNYYATVGGGEGNAASGSGSTIGGGADNAASAGADTIGGGQLNTTTGYAATVGGGSHNSAGYDYATVPGGAYNAADGMYSLAAGRRAKALHPGSFVWGDSTDSNVSSTAANQFLVRASGGVGINTASPQAALDISGSLRVGLGGTVLNQVEAGDATLGPTGVSGTSVFTITFKKAFAQQPKVVVTANGADFNDVFAVTTRRITTSSFAVNVYRVDQLGASWGQALKLDWIAWY